MVEAAAFAAHTSRFRDRNTMARKHFLSLLLVAALAGACSDGGATGDAGASSLLGGMYVATSTVTAETAQAAALADGREEAEAGAWEALTARVAPATPAGALIDAMDAAFTGDATGASPIGLRGALVGAIARGRAAPGDAIVQKASQETAEKTLLNAQHLAMVTEVRAALAAAEAGRWIDARARWDRAAVFFNGLNAKFQTRADTQVPGVWGPGNDALSDENLSLRVTQLLTNGARLLDARAADNFADTAAQAEVYTDKYFFLSAVNYGNVYASRVASMMDLEYPRAEGRALFEAVAVLWGGRSTDAAMMTAMSASRARWERGAPTGPTRVTVMQDCARIYAITTGGWTAAYATASARERIAIRGRVRGMVDLLDEALAYARHDPAALRAKITQAEARSASGDHAGAAALLEEVRAAVESVTRAGS